MNGQKLVSRNPICPGPVAVTPLLRVSFSLMTFIILSPGFGFPAKLVVFGIAVAVHATRAVVPSVPLLPLVLPAKYLGTA